MDEAKNTLEEKEDVLEGTPLFSKIPAVPHYHGDAIRKLFVACALLSLFVIPLWGNLLPFGLMFELGTIILLVLFAGLTNPHGKFILALDTLIAGTGAFLLEAAAIDFYGTESIMLFIAREIAAILLLLAFYFSVKTLRALMLGQVGHMARVGEFDESKK